MHDQGFLPTPNEGGPIAFLVGCARLAKDYNDTFLTERIEQEKEQQQKRKKQQQQSNESESPNTVGKKSSAFPNKRPK